MKRLHIYVAGPYTPKEPCTLHDASRVAQQNTLKAIKIGNAIFAKGHYAFIPHLSHYTHINCERNLGHEADFWYQYDLTFLRQWANALFYMSPSYGADIELKEAKRLYYRIFKRIGDIPVCDTLR